MVLSLRHCVSALGRRYSPGMSGAMTRKPRAEKASICGFHVKPMAGQPVTYISTYQRRVWFELTVDEDQEWSLFWTSREVEGLLLASSIIEGVLFESHHLANVVNVESMYLD